MSSKLNTGIYMAAIFVCNTHVSFYSDVITMKYAWKVSYMHTHTRMLGQSLL